MIIKQYCRICDHPLETVWDLGDFYVSTFLRKEEKADRKLPLVLCKCNYCGLIQLKHTVDQDETYRQYWYKSSLNPSMKTSLKHVVHDMHRTIRLKEGDIAIDIGCNSGTLFDYYRTTRLYKCGFDPAKNLKEEAEQKCDLFINDYFTADKYFLELDQKARAITTIAMFYDLENPNQFVKDVSSILTKDGVWIIQMTDLLSMLRINAVDNICHEHSEYYSLRTLAWLLERHNLEIFKVSYNDVNGGSIRVFVGHAYQHIIEKSAKDALIAETNYLATDSLEKMKERVDRYKDIMVNYLYDIIVNKGNDIFIAGASTKGNTLVQYFGIDNTLIPYAAEVHPDKFGLRMVGSDIEIIDEKEALNMNPHAFLVLPWHFKGTFSRKYRKYLNNGGKLIFPLPEPTIVTGDSEWVLK